MATTTPVDLQVDPPAPDATTDPMGSDPAASVAARYLLAALSVGAGAIHFAMVPSHAGQSMAEGIGFALSGWFQVLFAGALLAKPARSWLKLGILANLVFVAVWAVSRTRGLPFGAHPDHPEAVSVIDGLTVGLEVALVLVAALVLTYPKFLADLPQQALAIGAVVPIATLMAATAVIASPSASSHAGDSHGGHGSEVATGAGATSSDGHAHAHDPAAAPAGAGTNAAATDGHADGHGHGDHGTGADAGVSSVKADERCDWGFNTQTFWAKNPPAKEDPAHLGSHAEHADAGAGSGEGNEHGAQAWNPITDTKACAELQTQVDKMEAVAKRYPTAQDAMDAGCIRVTIYVPGIAAHYACFRNGWDAKADLEKPEMLLYGGSQPWAPIVGLSYMVYSPENPMLDPSQELWVRTMPFHYHSGLCVKGALVIGGDNSDPAKCEASGGRVMGKTGFMGHYWMETCNSPDGVFSAANPRLDMGVANRNDDPKFDPATGGDPKANLDNPCQGSAMGGGLDDTFGAPDGVLTAASGSGDQTQQAAAAAPQS